MSIPDLPTVPEVSGQSRCGIKYHILGTVQQTLAVELRPGQVIYSDTSAMLWMTAAVTMNTKSGGGLGGDAVEYQLQPNQPNPTSRSAS